ncbi:hypothetical protein V498_04634 [Pseudogymnoascus sp. VKM F-4517 (FW-2822)]|nr:hypothetical protein V498_04634 [Pseudogymnoascus sp. VKM F-4517 (FW-2822)]
MVIITVTVEVKPKGTIIRQIRGLGHEGCMALALRRRLLQEDEDDEEEREHSTPALGSAPHSGPGEGGGSGEKEGQLSRSMPCLPRRALLNISIAAHAASLGLRRNSHSLESLLWAASVPFLLTGSFWPFSRSSLLRQQSGQQCPHYGLRLQYVPVWVTDLSRYPLVDDDGHPHGQGNPQAQCCRTDDNGDEGDEDGEKQYEELPSPVPDSISRYDQEGEEDDALSRAAARHWVVNEQLWEFLRRPSEAARMTMEIKKCPTRKAASGGDFRELVDFILMNIKCMERRGGGKEW